MSNTLTVEQRREKNRLVEQTLEHSVNAQWEEAAQANEAILKIDPHDVSALNRLGRSLTKLGRLQDALDSYNRSLQVEPANPIALRNRARLQGMLERIDVQTVDAARTPVGFSDRFVLEAGRSAVIQLNNLGKAEIIATILPGDGLELRADGPYLRVITPSGEQVGVVPSDKAHRLLELMNAGNTYSVLVVNANMDGVIILISETYRSPETHGKLPFPTVTKQSPETRAAMRDIGIIPVIDEAEEYVSEADSEDEDEADEDIEETDSESLPETDDVDEDEEE